MIIDTLGLVPQMSLVSVCIIILIWSVTKPKQPPPKEVSIEEFDVRTLTDNEPLLHLNRRIS